MIVGVRCLCANMEGAQLRNCNFEDPAGTRAIMEGVNLKGANLEGSCMGGVNLRVATLKNANLKNCILRAAVFAGADLEVPSDLYVFFILIYEIVLELRLIRQRFTRSKFTWS